jgi:tetratricopeptide (TPR) repeat protein
VAVFLSERERKIIPRWRDSQATPTTGELNSSGPKPHPEIFDDSFLDQRLRDWQRNKTISFGADLLSAAFVLNKFSIATDAANFILKDSTDASAMVKDLAHRILNPNDYYKGRGSVMLPEREHIYRRIHSLKQRLHQEPRNAIVWVDLALQYTLLDERKRAARAMDIALYLAPTNRFVLRSAARLYIHHDDYGQAHHILREAPNVRRDPWLVAAEISAASIAQRTSKLIKHGEKMLGDFSHSPLHITELATALATLELVNGNTRGARKLFTTALDSPTENSFAQAVWARKRINSLEIDPRGFNIPRSFEARTIKAFRAGSLSTALHDAKGWLYDQPFSARPAQFGSFVAGILADYEESLRIIDLGLISNPDNELLQFNRIFALASLDRVEEAQTAINEIDISDSNDPTATEIHKMANQGLICFRQGLPDLGRFHYRLALEKAHGDQKRHLRVMAAIFYAREEILAGSPQAKDIKEMVYKEAKEDNSPATIAAIKHMETIENQVIARAQNHSRK